MLKKITAAITCFTVGITALCGSAFADDRRWYEIYVPYLYSSNVTNMDFWNFTVSYKTDERGALTEEAPWVLLKVKEIPEGVDIETSEEYMTFERDEGIYKFVPNGFGYNWADVGYASGDVKVVVDGKEVAFPDAEPFIDKNGRTMVPVRFVSEAMGATIYHGSRENLGGIYSPIQKDKMYWNTLGRKLYSAMDDPEGIFVKVPVYIDTGNLWITVEYGDIELHYNIGEDKLYNYDAEEHAIALDTVGFLKNDRTYIPLRFFSEALNASVEWDDSARTVNIVSSKL